MLNQLNRLRKNQEFRMAFQHGKAVPSKYVVMYYRENGNQKSRIGFSVSKKVIGGSVERSRVKRILREAVRLHISEIKDGFDIVFIARRPVKGIKTTEVEENILKLMAKNKLLHR